MKYNVNFARRLAVYLVIVVVTMLFNASCIAGYRKPLIIPFRTSGNLLIVPLNINGQGPYDFIFDTGSGGFVISDSLAARLKLKTEGTTSLGSPDSPGKIPVNNVIVDSIMFNGFKITNIPGVALNILSVFGPRLKIDGIFGLTTFEDYLVSINYVGKSIALEKKQLRVDDPDVLKSNPGSILGIDVSISGKEVKAHLDTGSPVYIAIPIEWRSSFRWQSEPVFVRKGRVASGEFDIYEATLDGEIRIGTVVISNPKIFLQTRGFPAMNIGYEFLKDYTLTIDQKQQLIRLKPANTKPGA